MAISYLSGQEDEDARHTAELAWPRRCVMIRPAQAEEATCQHVVKQAVQELGRPRRAGEHVATQQPVSDFTELAPASWSARSGTYVLPCSCHRAPHLLKRA